MNEIRDLHREAMDFAVQGVSAKQQGEDEKAQTLFRRALTLETQAADQVPADTEPTRSILYRSAAVLALDCNLEEQAERLANRGLEGIPPDDIRDELEKVIERARERRKFHNEDFIPLFDSSDSLDAEWNTMRTALGSMQEATRYLVKVAELRSA